MAECIYCGSETELYGGVPICPKCSGAREPKPKPPITELEIRAILSKNLAKAKVRAAEAFDSFNETIGQFPSGLPHPDGTQRIHNASRELSVARKEMIKSHHRLFSYLGSGIVPKDLKRSG
jgi:hypothetical protein